MSIEVGLIDGLTCGIGEGPVWDAQDRALYLVDVLAPVLVRYRPESGDIRLGAGR